MKIKPQNLKKNQSNNKITFLCEQCKAIGKVYVECWTDKSEGPFKIELIQHENIVAIKIGEIRINKKSNGNIIKFHFCGQCGQMIDKPFDADFIKAIDQFNPAQPNN